LKKCDRTSIEGFKLWKNLTQTSYPEKFLNFKIESKVLSNKERGPQVLSQKCKNPKWVNKGAKKQIMFHNTITNPYVCFPTTRCKLQGDSKGRKTLGLNL
jgi:hypothetical protein